MLLSSLHDLFLVKRARRESLVDNPMMTRLRQNCRLDETDIRELEKLCWDVRDVGRGVNMVHEGEHAGHVHLILSGWAARYKLLSTGARQITALLLPGDLCGLRCSMLARMDHGIMALTPVRAAFILPQAIEQLERARPQVAHALAWTTMVDEATLRAWIVNMGRRHALGRVAHLFCELAARISAVEGDDAGPWFFPLTQEEIADTLGLTPVHVNRILQDLRARGMVSSRRGGLTVLDLSGLNRLAGFHRAYLQPQTMPTAMAVC